MQTKNKKPVVRHYNKKFIIKQDQDIVTESLASVVEAYNPEVSYRLYGDKIFRAGAINAWRWWSGWQKSGIDFDPKDHKDEITKWTIDELAKMDPTPNKTYATFIIKNYAAGGWGTAFEDIRSKVVPALIKYDTLKRKNKIPAPYNDILKFRGFKDFVEYVSPLGVPDDAKSKGKSTEIFSNSEVRIVRPDDEEAAIYYGQGTRWCTAATEGKNYFDDYNQDGDLYILIPKHPKHPGEKYQLHFDSNSFMDEKDDAVRVEVIVKKRFGDLTDAFNVDLKNWVLFAPDELLESLWQRMGKAVREHLTEVFNEIEDNDYGYRLWLEEQGFIVQGHAIYTDSDKYLVNDTTGLRYTDYSYEASEFETELNTQLNQTAESIRDFVTLDYGYYDNNGLDFNSELSNLPFILEDVLLIKFNGEDFELSDWVKESIEVKNLSGKWQVRVYSDTGKSTVVESLSPAFEAYNVDTTYRLYGEKIYERMWRDQSEILDLIKMGHDYLPFKEVDEKTRRSLVNDVLNIMEVYDPTKNKEYMQFYIKNYVKGTWGANLEDISSTIQGYVVKYDLLKKQNKVPSPYNDILRFEDFEAFATFASNLPEPIKKAETIDKGSSVEPYADEDVRMIVPKDKAAAIYYGQNTEWCTAATRGNNYFDSYNNKGNLLILLPKQPEHVGEKYQLHFAEGDFMNEHDDPIDLYWLLNTRFPHGLKAYILKQYPDLKKSILFASDELLESVSAQVCMLALDHYKDLIYNADNYSSDDINEEGEVQWNPEDEEHYHEMAYTIDSIKAVDLRQQIVEPYYYSLDTNDNVDVLEWIIADIIREVYAPRYMRMDYQHLDAEFCDWIKDYITIDYKSSTNEYIARVI